MPLLQCPPETGGFSRVFSFKPGSVPSFMGQNGLKLLRDNGGATERHMEVIAGYL
jgi:hypothetical protein